jgi:membrane-associated phospholipid phosphatase
MPLRASEWISVLAFSGFVALAWQRRLDRVRRVKVTALGSAGTVATLFASLVLPGLAGPLSTSITRALLPCVLILLFYSLAGLFVTGANAGLEARLLQLDQLLVAPPLVWCAGRFFGPWLLGSLELAYLSYYVALPGAAATLLLAGRGREADHFWTVVLLAAYASCGMLAFVQTRPPRVLEEEWGLSLASGRLRAFNLWILRNGSVGANTFPSAHVAIVVACALALLHAGPLWAGAAFLVIGVGVALGAVAGRYHYAADIILGVVTAAAAWLAGIGLLGFGR